MIVIPDEAVVIIVRVLAALAAMGTGRSGGGAGEDGIPHLRTTDLEPKARGEEAVDDGRKTDYQRNSSSRHQGRGLTRRRRRPERRRTVIRPCPGHMLGIASEVGGDELLGRVALRSRELRVGGGGGRPGKAIAQVKPHTQSRVDHVIQRLLPPSQKLDGSDPT